MGGIVPDAAGIANIEGQPVQPNSQRQSWRLSALTPTQPSESLTELTALPSPPPKSFILPELDSDGKFAGQNAVAEGGERGVDEVMGAVDLQVEVKKSPRDMHGWKWGIAGERDLASGER